MGIARFVRHVRRNELVVCDTATGQLATDADPFKRTPISAVALDRDTSWRSLVISRRQFMAVTTLMTASVPLQAAEARLPIAGVDHLSIGVSDVPRSVDFYMRLFGTELARDRNRKANPGSSFGELFFLRLGTSHLSVSPLSPGQAPGIDHFCFAVDRFDKAAMQPRVADLNQPWPAWPSGLWLRDPEGHIIQLAASTSAPTLPTIVRDAQLVPPAGGSWVPAFQPSLVSRLVLRTRDAATTSDYYERLLGSGAKRAAGHFRVGACDVILSGTHGERFRVAIANFVLDRVTGILRDAHVPYEVADAIVTVSDPDGLRVEIGASAP